MTKLPKSLYLGKANPRWRNYSDDELLDLRLKDVHIPIEKTGLNPFISKLYSELKHKGLENFKPHVWLSDEWFTPDGVGGIAVPFYLAHKRLARLQEKQVYDVEGGTPRTFMQLLRHECGHAIDNAFRLRKKRKRQLMFGKSTEKYEDHYVPRPFSRKYVTHLDMWYAQSHPDEDFAETFAVWLSPRSNWKKRYKGWGALRKLSYMDELMKEVSQQKPSVRTKRKIDPQSRNIKNLREYYDEKRKYYGLDHPDVYDVQLYKIFTNIPEQGEKMPAATFIRKVRKDVRRAVAPWTGTYQYTINELLEEILGRSKELNLRLRWPFEESKLQFISMLTLVTSEYIHSGHNRLPR